MNAIDRTATRHHDLAGFVGDIQKLEAIFETWDETARAAAEAHGRAIEALNAESMRRLIRALKDEPAALAALKGAVADELVYAVLRRHDIVKASLSERVETALEGVRPMLASHGGDVELISIVPPSIEVRFVGACDGCPASALTFHAGVKKAVQDACSEITEVRQVKGVRGETELRVNFVSPFAIGAKGTWISVGTLDDIPEGGVRATEVGGEKVLLSRQGNAVTCFQNACAHLGLTLDGGDVSDGIITCPHHAFEYDLSSGECLTAPEVQLHSHAVRVVDRRVSVRLAV